ncbi:MAG: allantoinase AllB [Acidobacteriaceae bacterium]
MNRQAFISRRVVTPEGIRPACILAEDGRIVRIAEMDAVPAGYEVLDFGDDCILPGLVDTHVHINEPGRTEWEGFATATQAAAAGGVTTLVDMPLNCLPETTTVDALEQKRKAAAGQCWVDWKPWGGVVGDNQMHIVPLAEAGVPGYKCFLIYPGCDGFSMVEETQLRAALPHVASTGLPLLVHAELAGPLEAAAARLHDADWRRYVSYLASRPDEAELEAIALMIQLCREYGVRVHIVHLSTAKALGMLQAARAEGLPITVETCPHYLSFVAEEIPDGATLFKCAPPIRSKANQELLWQGVRDGVIDMVVTDHSPCPPEMKRLQEGSFQTAWGGIASLSVSLSVMWIEMRARGFTLRDVARLMAARPAELAGLTCKGRIAEGCDADLTVFDPEATLTVKQNDLYFRHRVSPYLGEVLAGKVKATFVRGKKVFEAGRLSGEPIGQECMK